MLHEGYVVCFCNLHNIFNEASIEREDWVELKIHKNLSWAYWLYSSHHFWEILSLHIVSKTPKISSLRGPENIRCHSSCFVHLLKKLNSFKWQNLCLPRPMKLIYFHKIIQTVKVLNSRPYCIQDLENPCSAIVFQFMNCVIRLSCVTKVFMEIDISLKGKLQMMECVDITNTWLMFISCWFEM